MSVINLIDELKEVVKDPQFKLLGATHISLNLDIGECDWDFSFHEENGSVINSRKLKNNSIPVYYNLKDKVEINHGINELKNHLLVRELQESLKTSESLVVKNRMKFNF